MRVVRQAQKRGWLKLLNESWISDYKINLLVFIYLIICLSRYEIKTCSLKTKVLKATPVTEIQFYVCMCVCV